MKVLHIYKDYFPPVRGGVERNIATLCQRLKDYLEVEALVCHAGLFTREEEVDGVAVTRVGQWGRLLSAPIAPTFPLWLRRKRADILHFHLPNPTADLSYLLTRPQGKVVVTYHADITRQATSLKVYKPFLFAFLRKVDRILVTSSTYLNTSPLLSLFRAKCQVVPLGIDTEKFRWNEALRPRAQALQRRFGQAFLLFVGRLRYYKGLDYLLKAMERVDASLVIVGQGPEERHLKGLARHSGLQDKVHFIGEVEDGELKAFYHACTALVLPSINRGEAYGLVQLEAHASGKPVISTTLGTGVEFVNLHEKTGLLVPPQDPKALAEAINRILRDEGLRERLGAFAQRRAVEEFDEAQMVQKILSVYREVTGSR